MTKLAPRVYLPFVFSLLILLIGALSYFTLVNSLKKRINFENLSSAKNQATLVARSIRQSLINRDEVAIKAILNQVLEDEQVVKAAVVTEQGGSGICVSEDNSCYDSDQIRRHQSVSIESPIFLGGGYMKPFAKVKLGVSDVAFRRLQDDLKMKYLVSFGVVMAVVLAISLLFFKMLNTQLDWLLGSIAGLIRGPKCSESRPSNWLLASKRTRAASKEVRRLYSELEAKLYSGLKKEAQYEVSRILAHNIRAPLATLKTLLLNPDLKDKRKDFLIRSSLDQISFIAEDLLGQRQKTPPKEPSILLPLQVICQEVLDEKEIEYSERPQGEFKFYLENYLPDLTFAPMRDVDIKSLISNMITNSVQASPQGCRVIIKLIMNEGAINLSIKDNGPGVSKLLKEKIFQKSFTTKGELNHGIGLSDVKNLVENSGGSIELLDNTIAGAEFLIKLPVGEIPPWAIKPSDIQLDECRVFYNNFNPLTPMGMGQAGPKGIGTKEPRLEDGKDNFENLTQEITKEKYAALQYKIIELPEDVGLKKSTIEKIKDKNLDGIIFVDEGYRRNTLQLCVQAGHLYLEKNLYRATLEYRPSGLSVDNPLILIDDNELVRKSWQVYMNAAGKSLEVYPSFAAFMESNLGRLRKDALIFVDETLEEGVSGSRRAKEIFEMGFRNICLVTGHDPSEFDMSELFWIKRIIGKRPEDALLFSDKEIMRAVK